MDTGRMPEISAYGDLSFSALRKYEESSDCVYLCPGGSLTNAQKPCECVPVGVTKCQKQHGTYKQIGLLFTILILCTMPIRMGEDHAVL